MENQQQIDNENVANLESSSQVVITSAASGTAP